MSAGLSADGLGLLVPVSRGISKAADPKAAAEELRAAINAVRQAKVAKASAVAVAASQGSEFIEFALSYGVLKFGDFTLKSGRKSPYFFNAGLFRTGRALRQLGKFYAKAIHVRCCKRTLVEMRLTIILSASHRIVVWSLM